MTPRLIAALLAAAVLPIAAQAATAPAQARQPTQSPQAHEDKAMADAKLTPRERARQAKSQNKQDCNVAGRKQEAQKKKQAPAG